MTDEQTDSEIKKLDPVLFGNELGIKIGSR